jgi:hypothetical protein
MDAPYRTDSWLHMEPVSLFCRIQDRAGQAEVYFTAGSRCDKESCATIVRRRQSLQFEWGLDEGDHLLAQPTAKYVGLDSKRRS